MVAQKGHQILDIPVNTAIVFRQDTVNMGAGYLKPVLGSKNLHQSHARKTSKRIILTRLTQGKSKQFNKITSKAKKNLDAKETKKFN